MKNDDATLNKKYARTTQCKDIIRPGMPKKKRVFRICALRDFGDVKKGDLGGFVESEANLSHEGNCWIYGDAIVMEQARVCDNARIGNDASVYGHACVSGNAQVVHEADVCDNATLSDFVIVDEDAKIYGDAVVKWNAHISKNGSIQKTRDYYTTGPIGPRDDYVTFYNTMDGIYVKRGGFGGFNGKVETFEKEVKIIHGGHKYEREYLLVLETAKEIINSPEVLKKYELTSETKNYNGLQVYRIRALRDFGVVKKGDLGGWIQSEANLSHEGDCWVFDDAVVAGNAKLYENGKAFNYAVVTDEGRVFGDAFVSDHATVKDESSVHGDGKVSGYAVLQGKTNIRGFARIDEHAVVDSACVYDHACVRGTAHIHDGASIHGTVIITGNANIHGDCDIKKTSEYFVVGPFEGTDQFATFYKIRNKWFVDYNGYFDSVMTFFNVFYSLGANHINVPFLLVNIAAHFRDMEDL